jgi:thiol:disulfide interchange protein DsbD
MEKFKIAMGFPMLATAVWLFWFTSTRLGHNGVLWLGLFLVILAAAAWVFGEFAQRAVRRRAVGAAIALALVLIGYFGILEAQLHWRTRASRVAEVGSLKESPDGIDWQPWNPAAVAKARAAMRPVLVDFTADNCLNCKFNKLTSLEIPSVRAKLKELNAVALLADFSDGDPEIAAELRRYSRPGVPLVLVYPRDTNSPAIVLPAILTPGTVLAALEKAAGPKVNLGEIHSSEIKEPGLGKVSTP